MPKVSLSTLAIGARQLVVQLALETTWCLAGSYVPSLTPSTMVASGFLAGAEMSTFLAPPLVMCSSAVSRLVKKPVDSRTTSTPSDPHGSAPGSRCLRILMAWPRTMMFFRVVSDLAVETAVDAVPLEQVREGLGVGQVVDGRHLFNL